MILTAWIARWLAPAIHRELDKMPVTGTIEIDFPRERTVTLPHMPTYADYDATKTTGDE